MTKGIYRRGNVYWIRYAGLDKRIRKESSGSSKFRVAEALLIKRRQEIQEGREPEVRKIANYTFRQLAREYLQWAESRRSFRCKRIWTSQLLDAFGDLPLRRFTTRLVEQLQTERIRRGSKPATVNRLLATLKHMFSKAADWEMVEEETLKRVRKVKLLEESNRRLRYLSREECQALFQASDPHLRPILITALNTWMRKEEILSLRWEENVDLRHGFILLDRTKNGERREIPINSTLRAALQGLTRRLDSPYVFCDPLTGQRYRDVKRSFASACRRAGIKDFRFHDCRHTFASQLVMAGADLMTVKDLLGHKTLAMTLRYSHLAPAHKRRAVDLLDEALNGPRSASEVSVCNLR